MDERAAGLVDEERVLAADDPWPPSPDDCVDLSAAELLDWAEFLPADGTLVNVLMSLGAAALDPDLQIKLARQWARVEAAAYGRKLAAVGAVEAAGPDPREAVDFRDLEVSTALNVGLNAARNLLAVGGTLAEKGRGVLAAMADGDVGHSHALQYFDALVGLPVEQCRRVEELTLDKARELAPGELRRLLRKTVVRVGADDFAKRQQAAKTDVHVSTRYDNGGAPDGMGELTGRMTAVDLNLVDRALEAWARAAKAGGDDRSLAELRVAGLIDFAERYLAGEHAPRTHGRPITVNIAIDLPTFLGLTDHPGELLGAGAMIPADAIRDLIPQAELRRLIIDPMTGHLLDYGRTTYRFPPGLAGFLIAKWVTSTGPGSLVPADQGDMDHGDPWDNHGNTDRVNGNPVNRRWHRAKTIGGWTVEQCDDGWLWRSPGGITRKATPHDYRLGP